MELTTIDYYGTGSLLMVSSLVTAIFQDPTISRCRFAQIAIYYSSNAGRDHQQPQSSFKTIISLPKYAHIFAISFALGSSPVPNNQKISSHSYHLLTTKLPSLHMGSRYFMLYNRGHLSFMPIFCSSSEI